MESWTSVGPIVGMSTVSWRTALRARNRRDRTKLRLVERAAQAEEEEPVGFVQDMGGVVSMKQERVPRVGEELRERGDGQEDHRGRRATDSPKASSIHSTPEDISGENDWRLREDAVCLRG
jgi:hypothetical protein